MRNHTLLLPFGKALASVHGSAAEFLAGLQRLGQPVADLTFSSREQGAATAGVRVGEIGALAFSSEPFDAGCLVEPQLSFALPVSGRAMIRAPGGSPVECRAGKTIIRMSHHEPLQISAGACAAVILRPSLGKLAAAMRVAIGEGQGAGDADAGEIGMKLLSRGPLVDGGQSWSIDYFSALLRLVALADDCAGDEVLLARIGAEDVLYRLLASMVLEQEHGCEFAARPQGQPRSTRAVDIICDHIRSTIGNPMSISQMEDLTGLTGRALNYAFRARFGNSPQEWQRNFLLDHARQLLTGAHFTGSVKSLSYELGFSSPSSFAAHYRQRFGERPSASRAARAVNDLD